MALRVKVQHDRTEMYLVLGEQEIKLNLEDAQELANALYNESFCHSLGASLFKTARTVDASREVLRSRLAAYGAQPRGQGDGPGLADLLGS